MHSLRARFVLSTLLVFALVFVVALLAANALLQRSLLDELARSALGQQRLLGAALAPLVAQRDTITAQELVQQLVEDGAFEYVEVDDADGRAFASAGRSRSAERVFSDPSQVASLEASDGSFHFEGALRLNGRAYGAYRFGIADRPLRLAQRNTVGGLVLVGLAGLVAAALLQMALARVLTRRLQALAQAADRLAAGEDGVALPVPDEEETARLTTAFNRMSQALEQRVAALQRAERELQQANDVLEERVAARTAELAAARDTAEAASRAKTEFLSRMSHELRTPLNAILGFAQVLRMQLKRSGGGFDEQLGHIETAGWHLLELINDVLDLSRIEAGSMVVSRDAVVLTPVLADCVRMVGPVAEAARVTVHLEAVDAALAVEADPTRLRQVLGNLLSNACKYNRPGGRVMVAVRAAGDAVGIEVSDSGAGLTPEQQAALFQPFSRLGAEHGPVEGTGIGLVITRQLVELMGGRLSVRSEPGQGATFGVHLRRATAPSLPSPLPAVREAAPDAGQQATLLYVEDNAANVHLLTEVLRLRPRVGLRVAGDGEQALALAREHAPDLVVVDIALPGIDGFEVCRRLRAQPGLRERPIVALSANAMAADLEQGRAAGFDRYFTKPLDVTDFLAWLDEHLASAAS